MSNAPRTRLLPGLLLLAWGASALAATTTTTFVVQATITQDCSISATNMNFGTLGLLNTTYDATSTITAVCTAGTTYNLGLDGGTVAGSVPGNRLLGNVGGSTIGFGLYSDAARSTVWGNTIGTNTVSGTGTGQAQPFPVYGRIGTQAVTPVAGTYNTTITVTVTY
jgi:spore coat protein U-like protein